MSSKVVVEMVSPQFALAYSVARWSPLEIGQSDAPMGTPRERWNAIGIGIHDASMSSSLIVINAGDAGFRPDFFHAPPHGDAPFQIGMVAPSSVVEFPLDETLCKAGSARQTLWGEARVEKLWSDMLPELEDVACYMLYRDPVSKRPLSVCAI